MASAFPAIVVYAQELLPGRVGMIAGLFFGLAFGMGGIGAVADRLAGRPPGHPVRVPALRLAAGDRPAGRVPARSGPPAGLSRAQARQKGLCASAIAAARGRPMSSIRCGPTRSRRRSSARYWRRALQACQGRCGVLATHRAAGPRTVEQGHRGQRAHGRLLRIRKLWAGALQHRFLRPANQAI